MVEAESVPATGGVGTVVFTFFTRPLPLCVVGGYRESSVAAVCMALVLGLFLSCRVPGFGLACPDGWSTCVSCCLDCWLT